MKRYLLLFAACLPFIAMAQNEAEPLETVYQKKAFELFSQVAEDDTDNMCFSPLSVQMVMSMVQNGAAGNTLSQMQEALGTTGYSNDEVNAFNQKLEETITYRPEYSYNPNMSWWTEEQQRELYDYNYPLCEMANGIWTRPGTTWHEQFLQTMRDCYKAGAGSVDFTTQEGIDEINGWVSEKTHKLIPKVFDTPLLPSVAMVLADALYFSGKWSTPFSPSKTQPGIFHNTDGTSVQTNMMRMQANQRISKTDIFRTLTLFYGVGDFSMTIFLPTEGIHLPSLTYDDWKQVLDEEEKFTYVDLQMPTFVVEDKYELNEVLKRMGMVDAFSDYADFSNMSDELLSINEVFQCSKIAVDEKGTEAAAVTVALAVNGMSEEKEEFNIDRPFYFTIEHRKTGSVLFVGRVSQLQGTAAVAPLTLEKYQGTIHDLQGRRLNAIPQKGAYIKNGKKYIK